MKNIKNFTISIFAILGIVLILTAFSNQAEQKKVYEFETVTVVESLIQNGLGRSRMISKTETVDYREATIIWNVVVLVDIPISEIRLGKGNSLLQKIQS